VIDSFEKRKKVKVCAHKRMEWNGMEWNGME